LWYHHHNYHHQQQGLRLPNWDFGCSTADSSAGHCPLWHARCFWRRLCPVFRRL
jgi:hypothetical protein